MRVGELSLYKRLRHLERNAPYSENPYENLFIGSDNGTDIIIESNEVPEIRITKFNEFMDFLEKHKPAIIYIRFFKDKDGNWIERPKKDSALDKALKELKKIE